MTVPSAALRGVLSPVLTPFLADGSPSLEHLVRHCRWLLARDVGLALFGTNSEANSLSCAEKRDLLDGLIDAGLPPARMLPGTGACALPDAIALTRHAVTRGCAGVLMLPPFFYKGVSDEGLFRGFAQVIEAVADARLRVVLYHIPLVAQVGISMALIERLLNAFPGTIAGIKDSGGDWDHTARLIETFQSDAFSVFAGNETVLLRTLQHGGAGCITATGNINPDAIMRLVREWQLPDAQAQQHALNATRAIFQQYPIIPAMKAAMAWQSADETWTRVRPPLVELDTRQRLDLEDHLARAGFVIPDAHALACEPACADSQ
ncbi:dihydrodipicolinate synthase family protein [Ralstonia sp. ASV6]|uniref:dihydrodipicolinate synthase family protein n=1 Tax=Ralstonia sp. ASV6 TaxID=2795124 RepID=UPI0018EE3011|nr:dihydrodipicolinate synthase family protein [Ralstonia sp. ASV6]